jgi:hypothetical protein
LLRTGAKLVQGLVWVLFGTACRSHGEEGNAEVTRLQCDLRFGIFCSGLFCVLSERPHDHYSPRRVAVWIERGSREEHTLVRESPIALRLTTTPGYIIFR